MCSTSFEEYAGCSGVDEQEKWMLHQHSMERTSAERNEAEQTVEQTDALLQDTVERLFRRCPTHLVGAAAREYLLELRPHLKDALDALADIEQDRDLTDEELARRRAFKILLL
jgi:hypothetical protein